MRLNTQYSMIFKLPSRREMRELHKELGTNIERDDFVKAYQQATAENHNFLLMDKKTSNPLLQYRDGLDGVFHWLQEDSDSE